MAGPVHISTVLAEAMADIERRMVDWRRLDAVLEEINQARARITDLYRELGLPAEEEDCGAPQSQVDITR